MLTELFENLQTAQIVDACIKNNIPFHVLRDLNTKTIASGKLSGKVLPVQHFGSVDIFFEVFENAEPGDILVIDNQNRDDEGCIGDLTVIEAQSCGIVGIIVYGRFRDFHDIVQLGFPVLSYGTTPEGPLRLDERTSDAVSTAHLGDFSVTREDYVFADNDGIVFVNGSSLQSILEAALVIKQGETSQISKVMEGVSLRNQFQFKQYLEKRKNDPSFTFRSHLREIGKYIEE